MSVIVALAHTGLLALQLIPIREVLAAPEIVMIRRADLPLTPAAEFF